MGARLNREDVTLGAILVGKYPTDTTTTPAPTGLPNRALDWGVLPSGAANQVLSVNADGSIGWSSSGSGAGTVTSVSWTGDGTIFTASADTPVTSSGTLTPTLIAQAKNTLLAGPVSGANAQSTFRAVVQADLTSASPISSPGSGSNSEQFGASASTGSTTNSTTIGYNSSAATGSVAVGASSRSAFSGTTALGGSTTPNANYAITIGYQATTGGSAVNSIALGYSADAVLTNSLMIGGSLGTINTATFWSSTGGTTLNLAGKSSTTYGRNCGIIQSSFNTSTDATWSGNLLLYAGDYTSTNAGQRLGIQIQSNGSAALVGLFGATPVVRPVGGGGDVTNFTAVGGTAATSTSTWTGASGASTYTVGDIVTALKALGILTA